MKAKEVLEEEEQELVEEEEAEVEDVEEVDHLFPQSHKY